MYQYIQGAIPNERVEDLSPILLFLLLVFVFVVALISFICFWVKSIRWFMALNGVFLSEEAEKKEINHNDIVGLLLSCVLIAVTFWLWGFIE